MKLDGLGVVLAVILLPIILIVTYYIQMQVDTIATENQYNTKLLDATYDAMSAFEINTANEELSSVADSMRSIILASNNVFLNTLATNLGISNASKEYLQPYIPAVLYTMYDGYYIYAPTETAKVAEKKEEETNSDGDTLITTKGYLSVGDTGTENLGGVYGDIVYEKEDGSYTINKDDAKKETDYVLKSYVQYSARYVKGQKDVTINYTLDNYLNIVGTIGNVYYTKTGYLIKNGLVSNATIDGATYDLNSNNENDAEDKILGLKTNADQTTQPAASSVSVTVDGITIDANWQNIKDALNNMGYFQDGTSTGTGYDNIRTISQAETYLTKAHEEGKDLGQIQNLEYEIQKYKAIAYYVSSACFSNWVYDNLSDLTYDDIDDEAMKSYYDRTDVEYTSTSGAGVSDLYYNFEGNTTAIFDRNQDPEDTESNFNTHKIEVIKNSIKYNLNLSMSAYNNMHSEYEASLPILLDEEWDKILSNISIVSFMQGWDCGLDIYNNYQIVSSTNNELTVIPSEIYYVKKDEFNNSTSNYHRIDCKYLLESSDNDQYISFKSKEVKYDKIYDKSTSKYKYDHKNLACYTCINTNNYRDISLFTDPNATSYYSRINSLKKKSDSTSSDSVARKKAGYIGIAKERQDIYKTNALPVSEGYRVINRTINSNGNASFGLGTIDWKDIVKLQITFSNTKCYYDKGNGQKINEPILTLSCSVGGNNKGTISLNGNQTNEATVEVDVSDIKSGNSYVEFDKVTNDATVNYTIKSIKAIYK